MSDRAPDAHRAPGPSRGTETDPWAEDERLWGRTYAIPFDRVWKAAKTLADGGLRGWTLTRDDDREGVLEAVSLTWPGKKRDEVTVTVRLDENAQTRVDVHCRRTEGAPARRRHPRIIGRFLKKLDDATDATPARKLDPTSPPAWLGSDPS